MNYMYYKGPKNISYTKFIAMSGPNENPKTLFHEAKQFHFMKITFMSNLRFNSSSKSWCKFWQIKIFYLQCNVHKGDL